jgi:hypothetical protein
MSVLDREPTAVRTPTVRARLRANRGILVVGALVILGALLLALVQSSRTVGLLDPDATDPTGSHAVSVLLQDQGVTVVRVTTAQAAADAVARATDSTLLIAPTAPLSDQMLQTVQSVQPTYTLLVVPDDVLLSAYAPWATMSDVRSSTDETPAGCDWYVATRSGALPAVGAAYTTDRSDVSNCWGGGVIDTGRGGATGVAGATGVVTLVGMQDAFTNKHLAESGYAALALGTLGRAHTVVWWLPSAADPQQFADSSDVTINDLVPSWVRWALLQIVLAMVVVVWWRGRRLGRVVVEPLPVVVRATESVEGRARLYRRGHARGRASEALTEATLARLRARLALPRTAAPDVVVAAVSARTGRPATDVAALLTPGSPPADDAGLAGLADALDALENEVRHS